MAVTPMEARCCVAAATSTCSKSSMHGTGLCPRCGRLLTEDCTAALLDYAGRADVAQRQLIGALRRLRSLPGSMVILPSSVLRNVVARVGWDDDLAQHADVLPDERRRFASLAERWPRPLPRREEIHSRGARLVRWLGRPRPMAVPVTQWLTRRQNLSNMNMTSQ